MNTGESRNLRRSNIRKIKDLQKSNLTSIKKSFCAHTFERDHKDDKERIGMTVDNTMKPPIGIKSLQKIQKYDLKSGENQRKRDICSLLNDRKRTPQNRIPQMSVPKNFSKMPHIRDASRNRIKELNSDFIFTKSRQRPNKIAVSSLEGPINAKLLKRNGTKEEYSSKEVIESIVAIKIAIIRKAYRVFKQYARDYSIKRFCRIKNCKFKNIYKILTKGKLRIYAKPFRKRLSVNKFSKHRMIRLNDKLARSLEEHPRESWKNRETYFGLEAPSKAKLSLQIMKGINSQTPLREKANFTTIPLQSFSIPKSGQDERRYAKKKVIKLKKIIKKPSIPTPIHQSFTKSFKICIFPPKNTS
ncbi:unnamed protein product [Moneuplotes crassus]|uniref:Uncharacterized protein n=1 Tax=Euplotes crassus TaxID=5936 RepID=A0AAD1X6G8_EUPCR|nr:unnamed protein product [Moneuplotes crassus]